MSRYSVTVDDRQLATILAALRYWQSPGSIGRLQYMDIATGGGTCEPLDEPEIDILCEDLNTAPEENEACFYCGSSEVAVIRTSGGGVVHGVCDDCASSVVEP